MKIALPSHEKGVQQDVILHAPARSRAGVEEIAMESLYVVVGWLLIVVGMFLIARTLIGVALGIVRGVLRFVFLLVTAALGLGLLWIGFSLTQHQVVLPW